LCEWFTDEPLKVQCLSHKGSPKVRVSGAFEPLKDLLPVGIMVRMRAPTFVELLKDAAKRWLDRDAFQHAGALGFCTLFSLAPLVIILVAIVGAVFGEEAASGEISAAISDLVGAQAATAVEEAVRRSRMEEAGILPTLLRSEEHTSELQS